MRQRYEGGPRRERASFKHLGHLKNLYPYLRRYGLVFGLGIFGLLIIRPLLFLIPGFVGTALDSVTIADLTPNIVWPAIGILGIVVLQFLIYIPARRVLRRIAISVTYDLRKRIFKNIQFQGLKFFNRYGTGDLMSRAINDVSQVRMCVSFAFVEIVTFLFTVSTGLAFMFMNSPRLALIAILPFPLVVLLGYRMARSLYPYFVTRQEAMAKVNSFSQENLNGIRTIQAMAQEEFEIKRFHEVSTSYTKAAYRAARFMTLMHAALNTASSLSPLIIFGYGGYLFLNDIMTLGDLTKFFGYALLVTGTLTRVGWAVSMFISAAAATERIFEIVDHEPEITEVQADENVLAIEPKITIRDLSYAYNDSSTNVLKNIYMPVDPGQTVAILGTLGSGKSTVLRAVLRLIDTPVETVYLGNHDVCTIPLRRLREEVVLVPQSTFLFSTSIQENVAYDDLTRQEDFVWEALRIAGIKDTVSEFEQDLETVVGERGVTLSGGQKQRLALARGVIRDANVLLLDDVFSSVDTKHEEEILSELKKIRFNKTTILVSHRVSTVRHADHIYVLDDGSVIEHGTHDDLLAKRGFYADLEAVQTNQDADRTRRERLIQQLNRTTLQERKAS